MTNVPSENVPALPHSTKPSSALKLPKGHRLRLCPQHHLSPFAASMEEMPNHFSQLTLLLQAKLNSQSRGIGPSTMVNAPTMGTANITRPLGSPLVRCHWCEKSDHIRKFCPDFMEALKAGKVRFNDQFRLTNAATGALWMFERHYQTVFVALVVLIDHCLSLRLSLAYKSQYGNPNVNKMNPIAHHRFHGWW